MTLNSGLGLFRRLFWSPDIPGLHYLVVTFTPEWCDIVPRICLYKANLLNIAI